MMSLQRAKYIGILCDIDSEEAYKEIYSIFSKLQGVNRSVWLLGYVDDKTVPFYCLPQLTADFFCQKDLNWYGRVEKIQAKEFAEKEFDILMDYTRQPVEPVRMLLSISAAHLIVGGQNENADLYDLLIRSDEEFTHKELLTHIDNYTKQLSGDTTL